MTQVHFETLSPIFQKAHVIDCPSDVWFHCLRGPDHGPAHDHPLTFHIKVLFGGYVEHRFNLDGSYERHARLLGDEFTIPSRCIHSIVEIIDGPAITMATHGPLDNTWSFFEWRDGVLWRRFHDRPDWTVYNPEDHFDGR